MDCVSETHYLHHPRCATSQAALAHARELGADLDVRDISKEPLAEAELRDLIAILEDPVEDLVRRDAHFIELGLDIEDVQDAEAVIRTLSAHPRLLQRPILIRDGRAIIGRPTQRVTSLLREPAAGPA